MKIVDAVRLAAKGAKNRWAAITVLATALCVFCFCFAGAIYVHVAEEKALPYELNVGPQGAAKLSESVVAQFRQFEGVLTVTPVVQIPVKMKSGNYSADMMLTGIEGEYIKRTYKAGNVFPKSAAMPYIVLNEAACRLFSEGKLSFSDEPEEPEINWLSSGFTLETGEEGQGINARVCGILPGETEEEEPLAFADIKQVRQLLGAGGMPADTQMAYVRVENIGRAKNVVDEIVKLGFFISNTNDVQQGVWDNAQKEAGYLTMLAILLLLFSSILTLIIKRISFLEEKEPWTMLYSIGMKKREMRRLFIFQMMPAALCGIAVGIAATLLTPLFILPEDMETSAFALFAPWWIVFISGGTGLVASILPAALKTDIAKIKPLE